MIVARKGSKGVIDEPTWERTLGGGNGRFAPLQDDLHVDALIVGGGLAGVTAAYLLAREGRSVALVERGAIGYGATGMTTACITSSLDTGYADLERVFGQDRAAAMLASHEAAIGLIEDAVRSEGIECEFMRVPGRIFSLKASDESYLEGEREAAERLGVTLTRYAPGKMSFRHEGYLELPQQAKFHPLRYLHALAARAAERGAHIHERTELVRLLGDGPVEAALRADGRDITITASHVLLATHGPFNEPLSPHFKKAYYDSYVFELSLPSGAIPEGIYEDTGNPYQYFRIDEVGGDGARMILGGKDVRSDLSVDPEKGFAALREYADMLLPHLPLTLLAKWRGTVLEPIDGAAFIGSIGETPVQYAFGFSGNGMTYSTIAAHSFAHKITGLRAHPEVGLWYDLYDARRLPNVRSLAREGRGYIEEFFGGAVRSLFSQ